MVMIIICVAMTTAGDNKKKQYNLNKCNLFVQYYNISNIDCNKLSGHCFDILDKVPAAFQNKPFNCTVF